MLEEYAAFPLFRTVGIDSSFYAPPSDEVLRAYADRLPPGFPCVSKVWNQLTVQTFSKAQDKARAGQANPDFLSPDVFLEAVYEPYQRHFADHAGPFVFEFQAIGHRSGITPERFAGRLDEFFSALPREGMLRGRDPERGVSHADVLRRAPRARGGARLQLLDPHAGDRRSARSSRARSRRHSSWPAHCSVRAGPTTRRWTPSRRTTGSRSPIPTLRHDLVRLIETRRQRPHPGLSAGEQPRRGQRAAHDRRGGAHAAGGRRMIQRPGPPALRGASPWSAAVATIALKSGAYLRHRLDRPPVRRAGVARQSGGGARRAGGAVGRHASRGR